MAETTFKVRGILDEIRKVVAGKDEVIKLVLTAILAKGHILIEDIPGVGKTTLALAFSKATSMEYRRVQFTPDVLPTDVVGFHMYGKDGNSLGYKAGAVMCNLFLADEINRTSPKTQSALLEVMEEGCVTVDGITMEAPKPFTVIATQNPHGSVGTSMLPESQLDRFMIRLTMGYPDIQNEIAIMKERRTENPMALVKQVASKIELEQMQSEVGQVYIHDAIFEYIARLVAKTREHEMISMGISPRGSLAVANMSKAAAFVEGRNYVIPDDIKNVFVSVTSHRMIESPKARVSHVSIGKLTEEIINMVPAPRLIKG